MGTKKIDITTASVEELDRLIEQMKKDRAKALESGDYKKAPVKKSQGGMVKGFSPIARPQRFKGIF